MSFSISFLDEPIFYDEGIPMATGELVLGAFKENFVANLYQLSKQEYEAQWRHAIKTILVGRSRSALIVYYTSPDLSDNFEWWMMFREGDIVYFQNQLPWYDQLIRPFSIENLLSQIQDRMTICEDGERISEWTVRLTELEEFARTFAK